MRLSNVWISSVLAISTASLAPRAALGDVITDWNATTLDAIRHHMTAPQPAARALAMVHAAMYDAVNSIVHGGDKYKFDFCADRRASQPAAAAAAAHRVLSSLFPQDSFDAQLFASLAGISGKPLSDGKALGVKVADALIALRAADGDGSHGFAPFALKSASQFRPGPPPKADDFQYIAHFDDVKQVGGKSSLYRTDKETETAAFWADGEGTETAAGHWNSIAESVDGEDCENSLFDNARLYALLNLALVDASLATSDARATYQTQRPLTSIHQADTDATIATTADAAWESLLPTPSGSSYVNEHASFAGAGARILASYYDTDRMDFTAHSDGIAGVSREFCSFRDAAKEMARSRILAGVQFEFDSIAGLDLGGQIADYVFCHYLNEY
jgi:hypothetical protein